MIMESPETFHGVTVPSILRPNWDQVEAYWWRAGVLHAATELAEKIRNRPFVEHYGHGTFDEGSSSAADLIDPDKE